MTTNVDFLDGVRTYKSFLGSGSFGFVLEVEKEDRTPSAIKFIYPTDDEKKKVQGEREASLTQQLPRHENLVTVKNSVSNKCLSPTQLQQVFIHCKHVTRAKWEDLPSKLRTLGWTCIEMELCGRNLWESIRDPDTKLTSMSVQLKQVQIIQGLISGLGFLHSRQIIHRDLKPGNVMFKLEFQVPIKIGDFGQCRIVPGHEDPTLTKTSIGTTQYTAPEVRSGTGKYSYQSDLFSLGLIIWEIVALLTPRECQIRFDKLLNDGADDQVRDDHLLIGKDAKQLVLNLTKKAVNERYQSVYEVEKIIHGWRSVRNPVNSAQNYITGQNRGNAFVEALPFGLAPYVPPSRNPVYPSSESADDLIRRIYESKQVRDPRVLKSPPSQLDRTKSLSALNVATDSRRFNHGIETPRTNVTNPIRNFKQETNPLPPNLTYQHDPHNNINYMFKIDPKKPAGATESGSNNTPMSLPSFSKQVQPDQIQRTQNVVKHNAKQPIIPVGVFFSLDTISAATFDQQAKTFKQIYGPKRNLVCFHGGLVLISDFPHDVPSSNIITMREILTHPHIEQLRNVETVGGMRSLRVEEILAHVFIKLHEVLKRELQSSFISYAISHLSSFNRKMYYVLKNAIELAEIRAILVRESDAILAHAIYTKKLLCEPTSAVVAIEDPTTKGSDVSIYKIVENRLQLSKVYGFTTGMKECVKNLPALSRPKIFLYCLGPHSKDENIRVIREATDDRQWVDAMKITVPLEGATLLACLKYDSTYSTRWDEEFQFANLIQIVKTTPNLTHAQIEHVGENLPYDRKTYKLLFPKTLNN